MANVGFKQEPVFYHNWDDVMIKIIKLGEDEYLWVQYKDGDGGLELQPPKSYNKEQLKKMVSFFQSYGNVEAIDMFEKFLQL